MLACLVQLHLTVLMQFVEAPVDFCCLLMWSYWERTSGSQRIFGEWKDKAAACRNLGGPWGTSSSASSR